MQDNDGLFALIFTKHLYKAIVKPVICPDPCRIHSVFRLLSVSVGPCDYHMQLDYSNGIIGCKWLVCSRTEPEQWLMVARELQEWCVRWPSTELSSCGCWPFDIRRQGLPDSLSVCCCCNMPRGVPVSSDRWWCTWLLTRLTNVSAQLPFINNTWVRCEGNI